MFYCWWIFMIDFFYPLARFFVFQFFLWINVLSAFYEWNNSLFCAITTSWKRPRSGLFLLKYRGRISRRGQFHYHRLLVVIGSSGASTSHLTLFCCLHWLLSFTSSLLISRDYVWQQGGWCESVLSIRGVKKRVIYFLSTIAQHKFCVNSEA